MSAEQQPPPSTAQDLHEAGYAEMDSITNHPFAPLNISGSISRKPIRKPVGTSPASPSSVQGLPLHEAMESLTTDPKVPVYQAYHPQTSAGPQATHMYAAANTTVSSQQYEAYSPTFAVQEAQSVHRAPTRSSSTVSTQSYQGGQYNRQSGGYTAYQAYSTPGAPSPSQSAASPGSSHVTTAIHSGPAIYPQEPKPLASQISGPPSQVSTPDTIKSRLSSISYQAYPVPDHYSHQEEPTPAAIPASPVSLHQVYEMGGNHSLGNTSAPTDQDTQSPPPPPPGGPPPGYQVGQMQQQPGAVAASQSGVVARKPSQPAGPPPNFQQADIPSVAPLSIRRPASTGTPPNLSQLNQPSLPAGSPIIAQQENLPPAPAGTSSGAQPFSQPPPPIAAPLHQQDQWLPPSITGIPADIQQTSQPPPPPGGPPTQNQPPPPAGPPPNMQLGNVASPPVPPPDVSNGSQTFQSHGQPVNTPQQVPSATIYAPTPAPSAVPLQQPYQQPPLPTGTPFSPASHTTLPTATPPPTYQQAQHHQVPAGGTSLSLQQKDVQAQNPTPGNPPPSLQANQAQYATDVPLNMYQGQIQPLGPASTHVSFQQHPGQLPLQPAESQNQQPEQLHAQRPMQTTIQTQFQQQQQPGGPPGHQVHRSQSIPAVASPYQYPQAQSVPVPQGVTSPADYFGAPLHHSQSMGTLPSNCPNICAGCKSGIPYLTQFSSCGVCSIFLCINCVPHHMPAHQISMIRLTSQQTLASAYRDPRNCGLCRKAIHVRYDCRQCQYSICVDCWDSAEGRRHPHSDYVVIEPPGKAAVLQYAGAECRDCVFRTTLGHCDLCLLAIGSNDIAMECATCELTFDRSINLCRKCHSETSQLHDKSHRWVSLGAHLCTAEAQQPGIFGCRECGWRSNDFKTTISQHGHTNLVLYLGPSVLQIMLPVIYKTCMRKPQRLDAPLSTSTPFNGRIWGCDWCRNRFPMPEAYRCRGCPDFDLCTYCYPTASHLHKHGQAAFAYLGAPAASATGIIGGVPGTRGPVAAGRGAPAQRGGPALRARGGAAPGRGRGAPTPAPARPMSVGIKAVDQHLAKWDSNGKLKQGLITTGKGFGQAFLALNGIPTTLGRGRGRGTATRPVHQQQQQQQAGVAGVQPVYIVGGDGGGGDAGGDTTYVTETTYVETDTTYGADGSVEVDTTVIDTTTVDTSSVDTSSAAATSSGFDWSSLVSGGGDGGGSSWFSAGDGGGGDGGGDS